MAEDTTAPGAHLTDYPNLKCMSNHPPEIVTDVSTRTDLVLILALIVFFLTSLRIFTRITKKRFWWDDVFAVSGTVYVAIQVTMLWMLFERTSCEFNLIALESAN